MQVIYSNVVFILMDTFSVATLGYYMVKYIADHYIHQDIFENIKYLDKYFESVSIRVSGLKYTVLIVTYTTVTIGYHACLLYTSRCV